MKILCVIKTTHGAQWLVAQAKTMRSRGHEVTVLLPLADGPLGRDLRAVGASTRSLPVGLRAARLPLLPLDALRLRLVVMRERPDVVLYQLWASAVMARLALVGLRRPRRVHAVPGPLFLDNPLLAALERVLAGADHKIIAGSRYTARRYLELGVPRERLVTIPYGADTTYFQPPSVDERRQARQALGLDVDAVVVVMVALVYGGKWLVHHGQPIKGHRHLLEAWRVLPPGGPARHLLLVGDGFDAPGRAHRAELMREFAIAADSTIIWLPTLDDVRPAYRAADISVSPSLSDNHGAVAEAAAMGVPSIVSDAGALAEAAGDAGWTFPAGDVPALAATILTALAATPQDLEQRRHRSRRHAVEHLDASAALERFVDVLEEGERT